MKKKFTSSKYRKVNKNCIISTFGRKNIQNGHYPTSFWTRILHYTKLRQILGQFLAFWGIKNHVSEIFLKVLNISLISRYGKDHFAICEICCVLRRKKLQQVRFLS